MPQICKSLTGRLLYRIKCLINSNQWTTLRLKWQCYSQSDDTARKVSESLWQYWGSNSEKWKVGWVFRGNGMKILAFLNICNYIFLFCIRTRFCEWQTFHLIQDAQSYSIMCLSYADRWKIVSNFQTTGILEIQILARKKCKLISLAESFTFAWERQELKKMFSYKTPPLSSCSQLVIIVCLLPWDLKSSTLHLTTESPRVKISMLNTIKENIF